MKLQAAVIFTTHELHSSLDIRHVPTYIESFMTIFGQCINVLNYKRYYT